MRAHALALFRSPSLFSPFSLFLCVALLLPPGRSFWPSFSQLNSAADAFHVTRTRTRTGAGPTPSEIHELAYNQTHTHTHVFLCCLLYIAGCVCVPCWHGYIQLTQFRVCPSHSCSGFCFGFCFGLCFGLCFCLPSPQRLPRIFDSAAATVVCWVWGCLCLRGPRAKMESENRQPKTERAKPKPKTCYLYSARRCCIDRFRGYMVGVRSESTYSRRGVEQVIGTVKRLFIEWETATTTKR